MATPATLNIGTSIIAYGDMTINSNPKRRYVDWTRVFQGITVTNPKSEQFSIDPSASLTIFSGTRTTTLDGTTAFTITASSLDPSRFRFTWVSGTNPGFRTDRGLALNGVQTTVIINRNGTATFTLNSGTWGSTVAGDTLFIPGSTTGDTAGPFNVLNEGYWVVLNTVGAVLNATRPIGAVFQGAAQVATPTSNIQIQAFSATGVQITDKVDISAGFSAGTLRTFQLVAVNPKWFEISSQIPIALDSTITPTASGLQFFKQVKQLVAIETDQECAIQANGDTGQTQRVIPLIAGDPENTGWYQKWGPMWSLVIVNRTSSPLNVVVISVE
jgi:hypothetical protein